MDELERVISTVSRFARSGNELEDITEKETRERETVFERKHADDFSHARWILRSEHFTPSAEI
jgi:hypothetical protein